MAADESDCLALNDGREEENPLVARVLNERHLCLAVQY
jgi:hypothetical protein